MREQRGGSAQHGASPPLWSGAAVTSNKHICSSHTRLPPSNRGDGSIQRSLSHLFLILLCLSAYIYSPSSMIVSQGGRARTHGGWRLWLVTTPLPSKWARATGRACVCVCVLPPAPPLHRRSFFQHSTCHRPGCQGNLLCWWVHLCVNHHPAVMAKAGWVACVCVCVCPFKKRATTTHSKYVDGIFPPPCSLNSSKVKNQWHSCRQGALNPADWFSPGEPCFLF